MAYEMFSRWRRLRQQRRRMAPVFEVRGRRWNRRRGGDWRKCGASVGDTTRRDRRLGYDVVWRRNRRSSADGVHRKKRRETTNWHRSANLSVTLLTADIQRQTLDFCVISKIRTTQRPQHLVGLLVLDVYFATQVEHNTMQLQIQNKN